MWPAQPAHYTVPYGHLLRSRYTKYLITIFCTRSPLIPLAPENGDHTLFFGETPACTSRPSAVTAFNIKRPFKAALLDIGVFHQMRSGPAVHVMCIACLCLLREISVFLRFAHVCTCHAWGTTMMSVM